MTLPFRLPVSPHDRQAARGVLRDHRGFLTLVGVYVLAGAVVAGWFGALRTLGLGEVFSMMFILMFVSVVLMLALHAVWVAACTLTGRIATDRSLFGTIWADLRARCLRPERLWPFLIVLVGLPFFIGTSGNFRRLIPLVQPFAWDRRLMQLDRLIHFGHDPWQLLQPILGHPWVTHVLATLYSVGWMMALYGVVAWQAWSSRSDVRLRFFLSVILGYVVLGTVAAIAFSAAGPAFYAGVVGQPDPYAPLMGYLHGVDAQAQLSSVFMQRVLWNAYASSPPSKLANFITAFPSMHVAMCTLFAAVGWKTNRRLGVLFTVFAFLIFLGSIHLGWHYATDGYVSASVMLGLWAFTGWWVRARHRRTHAIPDSEALSMAA